MKSKVIVINNKKTKILLITILFLLIFIITNIKIKNSESISNNNDITNECITNIYKKLNINEEVNNVVNIKNNESKVDFPQEIEGREVIGKLEISKIDLTTYILSETSKENLNKSVTKLCGPKVNGVGNLCITGHNYHNEKMFGDLKKLEKGDKIKITDMKGKAIEYQVYDIYKVYPKDVECLSQETGGEREVTLITCTTGAVKRLIVKAVEIYD